MRRLEQEGSRLLQAPLLLILVMPLFYYPLANSVLIPILTAQAPGLADSSRTIVALGLAALLVISLGLNVVMRKPMAFHSESQVFWKSPEAWATLLLIWLLVVTVFQRQPTSMQNLTAYAVSLAILYAAHFDTPLVEKFLRPVTLLFAAVFSLAGLIGIFNYSVFLFIGSNPRLYATYGVITICMLFAIRIPTIVRISLLAALYASIVISESRTAFVTAILVTIVGFIIQARRPVIAAIAVISTGIVVLFFTLRLPLISSRMAVNDITTPGLTINDSGRAAGWRAVIDSFLKEPLFGQGAGSGQTVTLRDAFPIDHPHSEYLRILHDGGLVAGLLATIVIGLLMWQLRPRISGRVSHPLVVGAFLLIVAGLALGTIENFLVFPSLMWPAAVLVGIGLKQSRKEASATSVDEIAVTSQSASDPNENDVLST